jgi:hypothetical protein
MIGFPGTFHEFFDLVRTDKVVSGNIFQYTSEWWQARHLPNVLFVRYEEMSKDCADVVRRVASFLDIQLEESVVKQIVEDCSFNNMKKSDIFAPMQKEEPSHVLQEGRRRRLEEQHDARRGRLHR